MRESAEFTLETMITLLETSKIKWQSISAKTRDTEDDGDGAKIESACSIQSEIDFSASFHASLIPFHDSTLLAWF